MEAQTPINIYRKHSSSESRDKPLPTSPCKSRGYGVLPVRSRAVRSWTCSTRAATYVREHTAPSTPSQASQRMCQGRSPLLGCFCEQQKEAFQCCCCCCSSAGLAGEGRGEQRLFVNIGNSFFCEDRSYPGGPEWGGGCKWGLGVLNCNRDSSSWSCSPPPNFGSQEPSEWIATTISVQQIFCFQSCHLRPFIQMSNKMFVVCLLYAMHCARCWRYKHEQKSRNNPYTYILMEFTI